VCGQGRSDSRRSSAMLIRGIDRARNGLGKSEIGRRASRSEVSRCDWSQRSVVVVVCADDA
jgi:hypothetical protein